ncbi:MAG TPA: hypothetical protein DDW76_38370 [Cyanobacteria bacterium UBA11369]|nr:hypothetical protein [Cyanobacteria bacterium UBA11371]HBE17332.1 hypothetical protein [Cyanobacteria bacterium UBA11367]HBE30543.1 hypothetical protein [Cyanobacteria bacterium UBA11368]HBE54460.1 hypothetical protein [Cyanobacteria bacterium UBA11369]
MSNLKPPKSTHPISFTNLKPQSLNSRFIGNPWINQAAKNLDRIGWILGILLVLAPVFLTLLSSIHQPQSLPISAKALVGNQVIELEVARTPQQQAVGLMYRTDLPANRGMLFLFHPPQTVNFWMKNVQIHLDILFLKDGVVKAIRLTARFAIAPKAPPCTTTPCPTYSSGIPVNHVLELRGGQVERLGLKIGSRITIQPLNHIPQQK